MKERVFYLAGLSVVSIFLPDFIRFFKYFILNFKLESFLCYFGNILIHSDLIPDVIRGVAAL